LSIIAFIVRISTPITQTLAVERPVPSPLTRSRVRWFGSRNAGLLDPKRVDEPGAKRVDEQGVE